MADEPARYRVTVSTIFSASTVLFTPGTTYWVTPEIYNGKADNGQNFSDLCLEAQPEDPVS